jgi:nitrate/nitrite transport system permease protein
MDAAAPASPATVDPAPPAPSARLRTGRPWGDRIVGWLDIWNLTWFIPVAEIIRGKPAAFQIKRLARMVLLPVAAVAVVLLIWTAIANNSTASAGGLVIPTPGMVYDRGVEQVSEWNAQRAAKAAHRREIETTTSEMLADEAKAGPVSAARTAEIEAQVAGLMTFSPKTTFVDQVGYSLLTALCGVALAVAIGVVIGIIIGFSALVFEAVNPIIQVLKPVSPLAWFPVVYIFVNKLMPAVAPDSLINKPFVMAAVVVCLCALWPTLINTANGVANVDKDYRNVARVLRLGWFSTVWRIILPASIPAIFTGMRLSMGIGWMVLIAAEMMAVSNGLGMFVWNWYQSSNDTALSYLLLAVIVIGAIGFLLDRCMITCQKLVSHGSTAAIR